MNDTFLCQFFQILTRLKSWVRENFDFGHFPEKYLFSRGKMFVFINNFEVLNHAEKKKEG